MTWLVDAKAQEGKDYDLDKLLPFWLWTAEQDWQICVNQQKGVNSYAYTPGPSLQVQGIQSRSFPALVSSTDQNRDWIIINELTSPAYVGFGMLTPVAIMVVNQLPEHNTGTLVKDVNEFIFDDAAIVACLLRQWDVPTAMIGTAV